MPLQRTDYHVFRVTPQCEAGVCRALAKRHIWSLAPSTEAHERVGKSRSRVWTRQPVFPGYVFASIRGAQWGLLRSVPHLRPQPISMGGVPYRLAEADLAAIRAMQFAPPSDPRAPVAPRKYLTGELVRILQGPLASFTAKVKADMGEMVQTTVQLLGRQIPYPVPRHWVERAA